MSGKDKRTEPVAELRQKAEAAFLEQAARSPENLEALSPAGEASRSPEEARQTLHEVRVHQIELEMQNEELRRSQAELDAARARYFDLYDLAPVGYCSLGEPGLILEANLTLATLLGVARGALAGQPFSRFVFKEDQDIYYLLRKHLVETRLPKASELRMLKMDGTSFWAHLAATVAPDEEGAAVLRIVLSDISERKGAEQKIRQLNEGLEDRIRLRTAELEASNLRLQQFAYVASHDLQEPLRMVTSYMQLLEKRLADKLDADTREFMGYAVDGALRMQNLIEDLLAYSRVSSRGEPLAPVDSAAALKEALDRLAGRIAETGAEIDAQPLPMVMADRTQLTQLFQNLISNAIKFCKDRAPRVQVDAAHEAGWWRFSVTDNGIGIAPEYRARLFVIFKRLHNRTEYPGTGIGLAICKRIVERHGGEIGIESAAEGGSVFWFTLPEEKSA